MKAWFGVSILVSICFGCGGGVIKRIDYATPTPKKGVLAIQVSPPDASLFLDGQYAGEIDRYAAARVPVHVGVRRVKITRSGYYPWYAILKIAPREHSLTVQLVREIRNKRETDAGNEIKTGLE